MSIKYTLLIVALLIFTGCDVSTQSEKEANNLANIKANIQINDGAKDGSLKSIKVSLTDGKKQIINENIKVLLDNSPLELYVKNELYYTKKSFYRTDSLAKKDAYYFQIILPNNIKYPLAYIQPTKENQNANFGMPKKVSLDEDILLEWKNLNTPYILNVIKGLENNKREKNITEYGYDRILTDTLKTKEGKRIIPKSHYKDSISITKYIKIILDRKENGLMNPMLLKNSNIMYNHTIEEIIAIDGQN